METPHPSNAWPEANDAALTLAEDAGARELALAAGKPGAAREMLGTLLAHELVASHRLMMRLSAKAGGFIEAIAADGDGPDRAGIEAARLSGIVARLMERYRQSLLALDKLQVDPESGPKERLVRLTWGDGSF